MRAVVSHPAGVVLPGEDTVTPQGAEVTLTEDQTGNAAVRQWLEAGFLTEVAKAKPAKAKPQAGEDAAGD